LVGFCTLLKLLAATFYIFYSEIEFKFYVWYRNFNISSRLTYIQNDPLLLAALASCAVLALTGIGYFVDTT